MLLESLVLIKGWTQNFFIPFNKVLVLNDPKILTLHKVFNRSIFQGVKLVQPNRWDFNKTLVFVVYLALSILSSLQFLEIEIPIVQQKVNILKYINNCCLQFFDFYYIFISKNDVIYVQAFSDFINFF